MSEQTSYSRRRPKRVRYAVVVLGLICAFVFSPIAAPAATAESKTQSSAVSATADERSSSALHATAAAQSHIPASSPQASSPAAQVPASLAHTIKVDWPTGMEVIGDWLPFH